MTVLEQELARTKKLLNGIISQIESINDDLRAASRSL